MFKKISVGICVLLLSGCSLFSQYKNGNDILYTEGDAETLNMADSTDYTQVDLGNGESFRVAMLLPLSGRVSALGKSMKNSAMMAIGDLNNNNLVVQFYDTKSTASGARVAVENAIDADTNLIVGPLLSDEVVGITKAAEDAEIPVVSFSTSPQVLQENIYSLGLLNDEQIDKIIKYAASKGRTRLALVLADNASGINMLRVALKSGQAHGVSIVKVGFYEPNSMDFTKLVTDIAGEDRVKYAKAKPEDEVEMLPLDFNAILVPEYGNRLKSITSMFSYYDVAAPEVLFMGTSVWDNTKLNKETELYGAVYPVMPMARMEQYNAKYQEMFGEKPSSLGVFAYDAVALASALSRKDTDDLKVGITNPNGYFGMGGAFRIFANGKNEHGLDVVKVTSKGIAVVEKAPLRFYSSDAGYTQRYEEVADETLQMPIIFGKDAEEVSKMLNIVQ